MINFEKFCEEVFYESYKEHLIEVTIERLMRALQHDVGDAVNAGARENFNELRGILAYYKRGVETGVEWYGKGLTDNPRIKTNDFMQQLADAISDKYENLGNNKYNLIEHVLVAWFGPDGTKEHTLDEIQNAVANYKNTGRLF